jgi:hypothetical protein
MFETIINYLKYSGVSVILAINPFHWRFLPYYGLSHEWGEEHTHVVSWLFLTIRVWIDDGSW